MMQSHKFYGCVNILKVAIILILVISLTNTQAESGQGNQSGKTLKLSSLDTGKMSSGWGQPKIDKSVQDYPMAIAGQKFDHGIGTHANSLMYIDLNGGTKRFKAFVGVDDEVPLGKATVQFRIYGDGKKLWQNEVMKSGDKAAAVDVDLAGVKIFILSVSSTLDGIDFDHANWAQA
ncbi:MAG: NPCBM/NEW2 domain-containing protein, partial [Planctomycetota bacterium]|nr:NPCBM/NEW2 domain-containing protein [Planctomycetota bacterium]